MTRNVVKVSMMVLSFLFFFVLFLPITGHEKLVFAAVNNVSGEVAITTVKEILPEIKLNVKSKDIVKGKSFALKVYKTTSEQNITYKSSDETIATVSDKGIIKGLEIGSATITVTVKEGTKTIEILQCDISVGVPALYIRFTKSDILMVVGQKTTLKYLIAPFNTVEDARFLSLDSEIADISTGGRISANSVGTTFCYALIDNGYSRCKVNVISQETYEYLQSLGYNDLSSISDELLESLKITSGGAVVVTTGSSIAVTQDTNTPSLNKATD